MASFVDAAARAGVERSSTLLSARREAQAMLDAQRQACAPQIVQHHMPMPTRASKRPLRLNPLEGTARRTTPTNENRPRDCVHHPQAPNAHRMADLHKRAPLGPAAVNQSNSKPSSPRKLSFSVASGRPSLDLEMLSPRDNFVDSHNVTAAALPPPAANAAYQTADATTQLSAENTAKQTPVAAAVSPRSTGERKAESSGQSACDTPRTRRNVLASAAEARAARVSADDS